jgi:hypothetical protein
MIRRLRWVKRREYPGQLDGDVASLYEEPSGPILRSSLTLQTPFGMGFGHCPMFDRPCCWTHASMLEMRVAEQNCSGGHTGFRLQGCPRYRE